jgi:hypothetical protein
MRRTSNVKDCTADTSTGARVCTNFCSNTAAQRQLPSFNQLYLASMQTYLSASIQSNRTDADIRKQRCKPVV